MPNTKINDMTKIDITDRNLSFHSYAKLDFKILINYE